MSLLMVQRKEEVRIEWERAVEELDVREDEGVGVRGVVRGEGGGARTAIPAALGAPGGAEDFLEGAVFEAGGGVGGGGGRGRAGGGGRRA